MSNDKVYLKQNVLVEPLFNQWYAWSYLISPATAAMFIANSHLKMMQSFVSSPQIHIAANKNPAMRGGPFINFGAEQVPLVKDLLNKTTAEQSDMLKLAAAIQSLEDCLKNDATGYSLEPLYAKIPDALRGYAELVYDLNNNPSIRLLEGLMYKSPYYKPSSQSISLSLVEEDDRPFLLTTPTLEGNGNFFLNLPFNHEGLDDLFKMKTTPQTIGHIKEILKVEGKDDLFASFFSEETPPTTPERVHDSVRIRYFGHACLLIETKDVCILTDPAISYKYDKGISRYTYADLPEVIDYVLITHNHQDHCIFETLLQLRHKIRHVIVPRSGGGTLADPSLKMVLKNIGFHDVTEIDEMESLEVAGGSIAALPFFGEHADLNIRTKAAYLINLKGKSILCVADSNNIEPRLYEFIHHAIGNIDVLFVGMECDGAPLSWLYGPLLTKPLARKMDQSRRYDGSDHQKAMGIVEILKPKAVYVYAMGQEPWLTYLTSIQYTEESRPIVESNKLVEDCRGRGIVAERLYGQKEISFSAD